MTRATAADLVLWLGGMTLIGFVAGTLLGLAA